MTEGLGYESQARPDLSFLLRPKQQSLRSSTLEAGADASSLSSVAFRIVFEVL